MTKGIALCEFESRAFGVTKTPTGARALTDVGKANSRGNGVCLAVSIPATTRASASSVKASAFTKAISAVIVVGAGIGTSIMVVDNKEKK